mmetsp:Transcript_10415/g.27053  ORF Transcript_10415/g.27053 Transcript_10415/m.27053 type:complete len:268 (-) Transcript_10415:181-984(-)
MSSALGLPGHKGEAELNPAQTAERLETLKRHLNARLENKSARNEGNAQCLRRALKFGDLGDKGALTYKQWCASFERLGAELTHDDIALLFELFASDGGDAIGEPVVVYPKFVEAMTSGEAVGPLTGEDFVTKMSQKHGEKAREGKRTYDDRLFNKPPPYALGEREEVVAPRRIAEKSTNMPSVEGGIFAPAPPVVPPAHPSIKNASTLSLAHAEWTPSETAPVPSDAAPPLAHVRHGNASSVPGGIFAEGRTEDFRVRSGHFIRPGY